MSNNTVSVLTLEVIANALQDRHFNKITAATGLSTYELKAFRDQLPRAQHTAFSKRKAISDYIIATGATASEQPNG